MIMRKIRMISEVRLIIIIIIIDKTDAVLNGLCIRDITLIYDVINTYNYGSRCHGYLFCNRTVLLDPTKTYLNGF